MTWNEVTTVPEASLPVAALKQQLRLGSGFSEAMVQDGVLGSFLRAALAAIEARTCKALIRREFDLTVYAWQTPDAQPLPVAPVETVTRVTILAQPGEGVDVDPARYWLQQDAAVPRLRAVGACFPTIPTRGRAQVRFTAGFADSFAALPADLQQAVLLLAAHYYEFRDETALSEGCMPFGVTSLVARYRRLRMGAVT